MENSYGTLTICATPIGNLGDITERALETLRSVDFIAAEDTRHVLKLLNRFNIKKKLISCHEHNEAARSQEIIRLLKSGENGALVSDAGMPAISDPGAKLIALCINENVPVTACPGASACITALALSGLPCDRFVFDGFLPTKSKERKNALALLADERRTIVLYEAPHRLLKTLGDLLTHLGDRRIAVARELTKIHEEIVRENTSVALSIFQNRDIKGEFVLVIEGNTEKVTSAVDVTGEAVAENIKRYIEDGASPMEAVKRTAKDFGVPKREIYSMYEEIK